MGNLRPTARKRSPCCARAVELGIDLIDTADSYGPEVSEELIAEALHPYPDGLVIATKGGMTRTGPGRVAARRAPRAPARGLRGIAAQAAAGQDRPLPATRPRPQRALRGVCRRPAGPAGGGEDPPRRGLQRERRATSTGPRPSSPVVSVQNRFNLADRAPRTCWRLARARAWPSSPGSPLSAGSPGGAGRRRGGDRRAPRGQPSPGGDRLAAAALPHDAADPGDGVGRAPRGERGGGRPRAERGRGGGAGRNGGIGRQALAAGGGRQSSSWRWRKAQTSKQDQAPRGSSRRRNGAPHPTGRAIPSTATTNASPASRNATNTGRIAAHPVSGVRSDRRSTAQGSQPSTASPRRYHAIPAGVAQLVRAAES